MKIVPSFLTIIVTSTAADRPAGAAASAVAYIRQFS